MDPYGYLDGKPIKPDSEIKFADYTKNHLNGKMPKLSQLIEGSGLPLISNHFKLQSPNNNIATCGYWACARHLLKNLSLNEFAKKFMNKIKTPDYSVVEFCDNILKNKGIQPFQ